MKHEPRPGVWGDEALPGEIIRIEEDGTTIYNVGAQFIPLWGQSHEKRRKFRFE